MTEFLGLELSKAGAAGTMALLMALGFSIYALISGVLAGITSDFRLERTTRYAILANFVFVSLAIFILENAILKDDFSVRYVANHSMTVSPLWVKVVTLWAALEGSILLWAWIISMYAALVAIIAKKDVLRPWVMAVMSVSVIFFVAVNLTVASPFTPVLDPPTQGQGPNPLLQNHWMMAVHPVLMYLGFVGLSVPFAYAVAAMITGRLGESWLSQTRRWTMTAWGFLSAAIVAGGWWSYEILGWGGYWAWDAVENASFVPWLFATAFLHSVQIQERRRILKSWNIYLIVLAYASTVLGTFLTRSGVVESVHAFSNGPIGSVFLGFFAVLVVIGVGLVTWRMPNMRDSHSLDSPVSREGVILLGNVVFVVFAASTVLATLFPIFIEAVRGFRTVVGASFYNQFAIPLGLLLLLLMGTGPILPWRKLPYKLMKALTPLLIAALMAMFIAVLFGIRNISLIICLGLCAYNLFGIVQLVASSIIARGGITQAAKLVLQNPRRYGAYTAHFGIIIMAIGIGFSSTYKVKQEETLKLNVPVNILGKKVNLTKIYTENYPEKTSSVIDITINHEILKPKLNTYINMPQAVAMPAVNYHLMGDTYVTLQAIRPKEGWASVAIIDSPMVSWIWWGEIFLLMGTLLSLSAKPRELVGFKSPTGENTA